MAAEHQVSDISQFVIFRLRDEEFGLSIAHVKEIIRPQKITKIPWVSKYIEGVTNLRGDVIPVLSLRERFGMEQDESTDQTRIIIIVLPKLRVGFKVDSVKEVLTIPNEAMDPPPLSISGVERDYVQGVGKVADRLIIILDSDTILAETEDISKLEANGVATAQ